MSIVQNRKAFHDYFIEERHEAGLALEGWEVKAIRAGRAQINEAYVVLRNGALWLIGAHVSPLVTASTHVVADPTRSRKLLMHAEEIQRLVGTPWSRSTCTTARVASSSNSPWPAASSNTTSARANVIASGSAKSSAC
jgi:SsrA-binding protein